MYPQSMFWIKNKKKMYTPVNPSFTIIKSGFEGFTLHKHVFLVVNTYILTILGSVWISYILQPLKSNSHAQKYICVNILRRVNILRCANQAASKCKLRSHGFYHQEYFCM